jgi:hypothetical protein
MIRVRAAHILRAGDNVRNLRGQRAELARYSIRERTPSQHCETERAYDLKGTHHPVSPDE